MDIVHEIAVLRFCLLANWKIIPALLIKLMIKQRYENLDID